LRRNRHGRRRRPRYEEAIEWLDRAIEFSEARDADSTTLYVRAWLDRVRFERGEWGLVGAAIGSTLDTEAHMNATLTRAGTLGRLGVRRGDADAADALRDLVDRGGAADLQHLWPPLCGLAEAEWLAGRAVAGRELLRRPVEQALETDSPWAQGELGWWFWRCGGEAITDGRDRTPFDQHVRGDWHGAAERWAAIGCPYEAALALADGPTDSRLRALALFDRLDAAPAAAWLRQVLRDDGVTSIPRGPRRSTAVHPAGLTNRQSEVLALVADGLTNAEIAERLFVSAKTVEHHMSAVFAKLGVSSRRDAVERATHWPATAD
jgi:DNA-binding CsgD family transcriptional regulator